MNIAIITGASSGLGREYARLLAAESGLDELWLIARRQERLEKLKAELLELTRERGAARIMAEAIREHFVSDQRLR